MNRAFRVATVFTGTAACAAVLTPAAQAAVVAPGATVRFAPDASAHDCGSSPFDPFRLHLYYEASENHPDPACFGGQDPFT